MTGSPVQWTISGTLESQINVPAAPDAPLDVEVLPPPGSVSVRRQRPLPIAGVEIALYGETQPGQFARLAQGRTGPEGRFRLQDNGPAGPRRFRLVAQFRNNDLHVRP